jgi:unsaturated rhamnogalacturonyl hydrolase
MQNLSKTKKVNLNIIILAQVLLVLGLVIVIFFVLRKEAQAPETIHNNKNSAINTIGGGNSTNVDNQVANTANTSRPTTNTTPTPGTKQEDVSAPLKATENLAYSAWDWQEGVALQGLLNYAAVSGNKEVQDVALQKFNALYSKAPKSTGDVLLANQGILGEAALAAYAKTHDAKYLKTAQVLADSYISWSALAQNGAFLHYYPKYCQKCDNKNYVWADTLYMTVPFLVKMSETTGDSKYLHKAASQVVLHSEYLQDANGLIHHASKADGSKNEFKFWVRANGWYAASAAVVLQDLSSSDPLYQKISDSINKQMKALRPLQSDGLWHTVVDHGETYQETSGSALITYAALKGIRLRVLDSSYKDMATAGVLALKKQITASGDLQNTSEGTSPSMQVAYYQSIAHEKPQLYGQGAYFDVLSEFVLIK